MDLDITMMYFFIQKLDKLSSLYVECRGRVRLNSESEDVLLVRIFGEFLSF